MARQIQEWEKKNPDDVHEMPVKPGDLNRRVMAGGEFSAPREQGEDNEDANSDRDMDCV